MELARLTCGSRGRGLVPVSKDREIWFRRIPWGYFPIHWKRLASRLIGILIGVPAYWASLVLWNSHLGHATDSYLLAIAVLLALFVIASRHSSP